MFKGFQQFKSVAPPPSSVRPRQAVAGGLYGQSLRLRQSMSKESNRKLRKGGGRPSRRMILTEQQHAFCSAYIRIGSASGAAVYAGYHPGSGYRLVEIPAIKAQIQKLREQAERREEQLAEEKFAIGREFLDVHL